MNKVASPFVAFLSLVGLTSAWAQISPNPSVAPVPDRAHWELTVSKGDGSAPAPEDATPSGQPKESVELRSVEVTKTGGTQKVETKFTNGDTLTRWIENGQIYVEINNLISSGAVGGGIPGVGSTKTFFGTDWVNADNRKDQVNVGKVLCDYYEIEGVREIDRGMAEALGLTEADISVKQAAWIDATTRLPVAVSGPEGTFAYRFLEPPSAPLQLPAEFRKREQEIKAEVLRQQQEASVR